MTMKRSHRGANKEMIKQLESLYIPDGRIASVITTNDVRAELEIEEEAMTPDDDGVVDVDLNAREDESGTAAASSALETAAARERWPQESTDEQEMKIIYYLYILRS
jgi:hypothetical protein